MSRAYVIAEKYGEGACVRFASHAVVARREGATGSQYGRAELRCERGSLSLTVPGGDKAAWDAWRASAA